MNTPLPEETLDPQDWQSLRTLAHRMVDDMLTYHETVRERDVWTPLPEAVKAHFKQPLPHEAQSEDAVYQEFVEYILPHPMGNIHPRFWGWVMGNGTTQGMLADMLAAGMNPNQGGADHVANYVERQVLDWCKAMLGFPMDASGILVSGGSMANLVALMVARTAKGEVDIRKIGMQNLPRRMVVYTSTEAHSSNHKAIEMLGIGRDSLREIPVNADYQIDIAALEKAIAEDRAAGHYPFCIIGNAGTVMIGAFDDLNTLADICAREKMWFHVDGAFGALAALPDDLRPLVAGMERADSVAFDLHKWLYLPFEAGCTLIRDAQQHIRAFAVNPDYLSHGERGLASGPTWFGDLGIQLSRGFRSLKVWFSFKTHGVDQYARLIRQNVEQARYLAARVDESPVLERLAPVPLNVVCFRYVKPGLDETRLNALNTELLMQLQESGMAIVSNAVIHGRFGLRACVTNHRSRFEDFDILIAKVIELGEHIVENQVTG